MEELDLREKICRAFTTDITVAGGAREEPPALIRIDPLDSNGTYEPFFLSK